MNYFNVLLQEFINFVRRFFLVTVDLVPKVVKVLVLLGSLQFPVGFLAQFLPEHGVVEVDGAILLHKCVLSLVGNFAKPVVNHARTVGAVNVALIVAENGEIVAGLVEVLPLAVLHLVLERVHKAIEVDFRALTSHFRNLKINPIALGILALESFNQSFDSFVDSRPLLNRRPAAKIVFCALDRALPALVDFLLGQVHAS